ncbi:MAG TPA: TlpA disulfide reductase family protein [Pyrinomonadaceae bacterium]
MRRFYFLLFTFYFLLALACRPAAAPVSISNKPVSINQVPQTNLPMPPAKSLGEMTWTRFDGKTEKLGEMKGKVVVLDFWATYCEPCLREIPHLNQLQARYGAENLQIVGLHVGGEEDKPRVPDFVEKLRISYVLATPEDALAGFMFRDHNDIPQTLILNRSGNMVERFIGFNQEIQTNLDRVIEQTINEK